MTQLIEIKALSCSDLLDFFGVKTDSMSDTSVSDYRKAVASLRNFISSESGSSPISQVVIEDWLVYMSFRGIAIKTALHYLDLISSLYGMAVNDGLAVSSDMFAKTKARVRQLSADSWKPLVAQNDFSRMLNLTKTAYRQSGELALASDILLFSLINNAMPIGQIALLKKEDLHRFPNVCLTIAERHISPKRKYIFPLDQTKKTPRQLETYTEQLVGHLLDLRNIRILDDVRETVMSYWAFAALQCGISASDVVGILGCPPSGIPSLSICSQTEDCSESRTSHIRNAVSGVFLENPPRWYAMRLRPGVKFDTMEERVSALGANIRRPDFFYPCNEIAKRIKKKLVYEQRPILPDIVFFKSRATDVQPLFAKIGDLAWCYTNGGSYASIPYHAMEQFQKAIGKFTPDYELGPVGSIPLRKGDRIVVVGGPFMGLEGEIQDETFDRENVIYRILLWGENNDIEWRVKDSRILEKKN